MLKNYPTIPAVTGAVAILRCNQMNKIFWAFNTNQIIFGESCATFRAPSTRASGASKLLGAGRSSVAANLKTVEVASESSPNKKVIAASYPTRKTLCLAIAGSGWCNQELKRKK